MIADPALRCCQCPFSVSFLPGRPPSVWSLFYNLKGPYMAIVTAINLTAGGSTDEIVVEDQTGNPIPPANISWTALSDNNVTVSAGPDGEGFVFAAAAAAATETLMTHATYMGPGNPIPVTGPVLTINVTAALAPSITALQYDETSGT
jgi:hypothetical protein